MIQERAKELLPIIKAFADGKKIQHRISNESEWVDITNPCWNDGTEYRIKPEFKVVPYENDEEFYADWSTKAPFIKRKNCKAHAQYFPVSIYNGSVTLGSVNFTWETLLKEYEYADGTPCGKIKEE